MFLSSLKNDICNAYRNILLDIRHNHNVYELARRIKLGKSRPDISNVTFSKPNGDQYGSVFEVNEAMADRFEASHGLTSDTHSDFDAIVESTVDSFNQTDFIIPFGEQTSPYILGFTDLTRIDTILPLDLRGLLTCREEIINIVKSRVNKKSAGCDELPIYLFKFFDNGIFTKITIYFNHLIASGYFPRNWTFANVTPIPKPGKDRSKIENWRPISQLNAISKIFERIICCRMSLFIERGNVLPNHQFGFRAGRSTIHPIAMLFNDISRNLNDRNVTTMVTLDIQSAFDTVWHTALIYKLIQLGFPIGIIKIIAGFVGGRTFAVGNFPNQSTRRAVIAGVPQGSVLGPVIFNIFLYDIPRHGRIKLLQFADDVALYMKHCSPLTCRFVFNNYLRILAKYYGNWKLKLNYDKTELIHFVGRGNQVTRSIKNKLRTFNLVMNNIRIVAKKDVRYLGIIFSSNFRFNAHIDHIIKRFYNSYGTIRNLIHNRYLDPKFKIFVYKTYLRPILQYGAAIWVNNSVISSFQMERLRVAERRMIRAASNSYRKRGCYRHLKNEELYRKTAIDRIDNHLVKIIVKFFKSVHDSEDEFLRGIIEPYADAFPYKTSSFLYHLSLENRLYDGNLLLIFNMASGNAGRLVYSTAQ